MTEGLWQAVITGLFTLAGAALGAFAANWQATSTADRDREKDERHRKWDLRDLVRDRRLAVRDARCQQAEQFVSAMSEDFHQFRTHALWLLSLDPRAAIPSELHEHAYWQKRMDRQVFQYGPVVSAISSRRHDLRPPWRKMERAWIDMAAHYNFAYGSVVVAKTPVADPAGLSEAVTAVYDSYNAGLQDFIVTIDKIKASRLR